MPVAISTDALPQPKFRYSQIVQAGSHYYCSGLLGLDELGELVGGGASEEATTILACLPNLLDDLKMDWSNLVFARIFCTDMERFSDINQAWESVFTDERTPPARSAVGVSALPLGASVEIEFVLFKD